MDEPLERTVQVNDESCRVWEKGQGPRMGYLAGLGGLPRWTPLLDQLSRHRRVIAPSLPGFPGAQGHRRLDTLMDWISATLDLLEAAGLEGSDLMGESVGGLLAAEVAALCRPMVRRLVLVAPFGLFDAGDPTGDPFAQRRKDLPALLSAKPEALAAHLGVPAGEDPAEWFLIMNRANEAAARLLWPLGELGLVRRLHRITQPTLVVWGGADRVLPPSYAQRFKSGIGGPVTVRCIEGTGHMVGVDAPAELAMTVESFLGESHE